MGGWLGGAREGDARGAGRTLPTADDGGGDTPEAFAAPVPPECIATRAIGEAREGGSASGQEMWRSAQGRQSRTSRGQEARADAAKEGRSRALFLRRALVAGKRRAGARGGGKPSVICVLRNIFYKYSYFGMTSWHSLRLRSVRPPAPRPGASVYARAGQGKGGSCSSKTVQGRIAPRSSC